MSEKLITEDIARMCNVCRDLGYIGALADEYYHDSTGSDIADKIATYITELFHAKRDSGGAYFTEDGIRYWRPDAESEVEK